MKRSSSKPSKLYPILAAGRPVLAVAEDSDVARIISTEGCGVTADPENPEALANAIRSLQRDPSQLVNMGRRAQEIARKYARVTQLEIFTRTIEEVGG